MNIAELAIFAMLGTVMFVSKILMQAIPNTHLLAMLLASFTLAYRTKALIPLYVYVILDGAFFGFSIWWIPYIYIWLPLWAAIMLISKIKMGKRAEVIVYSAVCALHGLCFGTLYAPFQALMFGLSFKGMIAWIIAGIPFDIVHAIGNLASGMLVVPLATLLVKMTAWQEKGRGEGKD